MKKRNPGNIEVDILEDLENQIILEVKFREK